MANEVVELLLPVPTGVVVDMTVGGGGHARRILEARPDLHLLGIDRDPVAVDAAGASLGPFGERARIVHGGFEEVAHIVGSTGSAGKSEGKIVGILFDLGVSSPQLDRPVRGFSYWADAAPLDMRMDSKQSLTAETVVNDYAESELASLIARNGEERYARRIAHEIVAARPLTTTGDLVEAIKRGIPAPARRRGGHPARRTFQAIRMEVNQELPNLADGLDESVHLVGPGGRVLVLAYHSLEDRMVKRRFDEWTGRNVETPPKLPVAPASDATARLVTRRALRPSAEEIAANPRAESARLRAAERLAEA